MKKKLLGLAVVFGLVLSGCGGGSGNDKKESKKEDAATVLTEAIKETAKEKHMAGTMALEMSGSDKSQSMDINMDIKFKMNNADNADKLEAYFGYVIEAQGQEMEMDIYIIDGVGYADAMGQKAKLEDDVLEQMNLGSTGQMTELKESSIESAELENDGDDTVVNVELSKKGIKDLFEQAAKNGSATGSSAAFDADDVEFNKTSLEYTINKDGKIVKQDIVFEFKAEGAKIKMKLKMEYDNFKKQEIKIDTSDYK